MRSPRGVPGSGRPRGRARRAGGVRARDGGPRLAVAAEVGYPRGMIRSTAASLALLLPLVAPSSTAPGERVTEVLRYEIEGRTFESTLVYHAGGDEPRPGVLLVPNWMGPTEAALERAAAVAGEDRVVLVVDMYGVDVRPRDSAEAGAAAGAVRADRAVMRARAARALEEFRGRAGDVPLDADRVAAIGFCFGGGTVLELGRSGARLDAIVSFHGDLASPTLEEDAGATRARVLVLHGADDPFVPQEDVQQFVAAMRATDVDWQLVQYSGAVHSFTDPAASLAGRAQYDERTSRRAFAALDALLEEVWGGGD